MFGMCTFFLLVCVGCQKRLEGLVHSDKDYQLVDGGAGAAAAGKSVADV